MKRPNNVDSYTNQKHMKVAGSQASPHQAAASALDAATNPQAGPNLTNLNNATASIQNQMAAFYNAYYPTNSMYSQMGLNAWQRAQSSQTQHMFDTSYPPPPPLPKTPPPEDPPPPPPQEMCELLTPLPNPYRNRLNYGQFNHGNYRRGYGNYRKTYSRGKVSPPVASQAPKSGLVVKTPASLNGQAPPSMENAKQNRTASQSGGNEGDGKQKTGPVIHKKKRRKPMSERLPTLTWNREDAQRVLDLEKEYLAKRGGNTVIIKFPDPKLDYEVVKGFSPSIESVHFQQRASSRSCIVHLKKGVDVKSVVEELNKTPFGQGYLTAELKREEIEDKELAVEDIDPYTLYIGNFPSDVNVDEVNAMFRNAKKVDVGYAQKMKVTRYGFARFTNVDDAIEAYKQNYNAFYRSRSLIVRFRRKNRCIALDADRKNCKKEQAKPVDDIPEKPVNEEVTAPNQTPADGNESEEVEEEDTKSGVFESANNLMENWLSDDMFDSGDEEQNLPNLTGTIKHEPEEEAENESARPEDDDRGLQEVANINKKSQQAKICEKTPEKEAPAEAAAASSKDGQNESGNAAQKPQRNSIPFPNGNLKDNYWEEIRQRELSEREEKPNIESLQLLPPPSPPTPSASTSDPDPDAESLAQPTTAYGLVPFILPKQEELDEDETEEELTNKSHPETDDDFENAFNEVDNTDAAFESAWNELAANGT